MKIKSHVQQYIFKPNSKTEKLIKIMKIRIIIKINNYSIKNRVVSFQYQFKQINKAEKRLFYL